MNIFIDVIVQSSVKLQQHPLILQILSGKHTLDDPSVFCILFKHFKDSVVFKYLSPEVSLNYLKFYISNIPKYSLPLTFPLIIKQNIINPNSTKFSQIFQLNIEQSNNKFYV